MKTILDIENMKKQNTKIFDNAYNYLIGCLLTITYLKTMAK